MNRLQVLNRTLIILPFLALLPFSISYFSETNENAKEIIQRNNVSASGNLKVTFNNLTCTALSTQITGTVFQDFNYDGLYNTGSDYLGIKGMSIQATDSLGNTVSVSTDANGNYTLNGLNNDRTYRIEFIFPDSLTWASSTLFGSDNGTTVQFIKPGNCANLGVANPSDYCDTDNPLLATPCYLEGDPTGGGNSGTGDWLVGFKYDYAGEKDVAGYPEPDFKIDGQVIGSTWGIAYHRQTKTLFASASLKRHTGFGINGPGAIYQIDLSGTTPSTSLFLDLNTYAGINTGTDPRDGSPNNTLANNVGNNSRDINAFSQVGKIALGDLDISDDGQHLYTINLNERALHEIYIGNQATIPTTINKHLIDTAMTRLYPSGCGAVADYRPWALKYHQGKIYIGVVCSAESSQITSQLHAYIIAYEPANPSAGFTAVFDFDLNYARADILDYGSLQLSGDWRPWITNWNQTTVVGSDNNTGAPQPILSDIEFDVDGSMIIGLTDRFGSQSGFFSYSSDPSDNDLYIGIAGGDVLRICKINGNYVLEGGAGCAYNGTNQFYDEEFFYDPNVFGSALTHNEVSIGALALFPGKQEVVATMYDLFYIQSAGITYWGHENGNTSHKYELFDFDETTNEGAFGKANGLGDLELLCAPAPIEIGNFVWEDTDRDGVQDPGELGLEGIRIELYDGNGNLLAFDTTNNTGNYYFSGRNIDDATWLSSEDTIQANTNYYLVVGGTGQFAEERLELDGVPYLLTTDSTNSGTNRYFIDSDGTIANNIDPDFDETPFLSFTTSSIGQVQHKYDFGFYSDYDYGDLPDTGAGTTSNTNYETLEANGGPSHRIIVGLFLGDTIDADLDGVPSGLAEGDDLQDATDDEDGIQIPNSLNITPNRKIRLPLSVTNATSDTAYISAWIDWNGDGDFEDANELVINIKDNTTGNFPNYLEIDVPTSVLKDALIGFRVRLSQEDDLTPYGKSNSGEVEDYLIRVTCPPNVCLPISAEIKKE